MSWNAVLGPERVCTQRPGSKEHTGIQGHYMQGRLIVPVEQSHYWFDAYRLLILACQGT